MNMSIGERVCGSSSSSSSSKGFMVGERDVLYSFFFLRESGWDYAV